MVHAMQTLASSRYRLLLRSLCAALFVAAAAGSAVAQGVAEHVEYVDDIDNWSVEVFSGAANGGGFLQGPREQAGHDRSGPMVFLLSGEAFTAGGGVIFVITKDEVVRYLAGDPELPGYRDGPASEALLGADLSLCDDRRGGLYIADRSNRCLRRAHQIDGQWVVETVAGSPHNRADRKLLQLTRDESPMQPGAGEERFASDGQGGKATFHYLHSNVITDEKGNAYLIDADYLRRITPGTTDCGPAAWRPSSPWARASFYSPG